MRPPESFSTAATNRRSHSCCVSLMVAVLSFITKLLSCALAAGDQPRTVRPQASAASAIRKNALRVLLIVPSLFARRAKVAARRRGCLALFFVRTAIRSMARDWQREQGQGGPGHLPQRAVPC